MRSWPTRVRSLFPSIGHGDKPGKPSGGQQQVAYTYVMNAKREGAAPRVVVLAGPNGAGKSTSASRLLRGALGVEEFVNADVIAQGLSGFAPEREAMAA